MRRATSSSRRRTAPSAANRRRLLEDRSGAAGAPVLLAFGAGPTDLIGGASTRGTVVAGDAGAGRRRCGDADERQPVGRPGAVHRVHCRREQLEQLHDQHSSPVSVATTVQDRRHGGRRHEIRHSSIWRPDPNAAPLLAVGHARRGQRHRRQQRVRHRVPERPCAGRRRVGDARDQQPGRATASQS